MGFLKDRYLLMRRRVHKFFKTPHMTKKFCVRSAHKEILLSDY